MSEKITDADKLADWFEQDYLVLTDPNELGLSFYEEEVDLIIKALRQFHKNKNDTTRM